MGIVSDAGKMELSEGLKETVILYAEMIKTLRRLNTLIGEGKPWKHEEVRFFKLETKVNTAFNDLSHEEQMLIVNHLIIERLMPDEIGRALEVFRGRITNVNA